jgi:ferric-dicitrate binding protein FerR (iron transport regulator)
MIIGMLIFSDMTQLDLTGPYEVPLTRDLLGWLPSELPFKIREEYRAWV